MDHDQPSVTVHRKGDCDESPVCPAFTTVDTDPTGGYVVHTVVTDPGVLAAHAHLIGPGEALGRVDRALAPEVFGA